MLVSTELVQSVLLWTSWIAAWAVYRKLGTQFKEPRVKSSCCRSPLLHCFKNLPFSDIVGWRWTGRVFIPGMAIVRICGEGRIMAVKRFCVDAVDCYRFLLTTCYTPSSIPQVLCCNPAVITFQLLSIMAAYTSTDAFGKRTGFFNSSSPQ